MPTSDEKETVRRPAVRVNLCVPADVYEMLKEFPDLNMSKIATDAFRKIVCERKGITPPPTLEDRVAKLERILKTKKGK